MGVTWTEEQQKVIDLRNRNILVSAAAGSGKTAVLVERIITMLTKDENPMDVDRLLIVTFTEAAAGEMKERIRGAIEKALEAYPEHEHLKQQATLIHNARITTIHSFCLSVIRDHFHAIDIDPGFRVGEEGELKLLRHDVLGELLERKYQEGDQRFLDFSSAYGSGRNDKKLEDLILKIYEFSRSYPDAEEWLRTCVDSYGSTSAEELEGSRYLTLAAENIHKYLEDARELLEMGLSICREEDGPAVYETALLNDLQMLDPMLAEQSFGGLYQKGSALSWGRLAANRDKTVSEEKAEQVKALRSEAKDLLKEVQGQYLYESPEEMLEKLKLCSPAMEELADLVREFGARFEEKKRTRNLIDFSDMEQYALQILTEKTEGGLVPSAVAAEYQDQFEEIMIDEYQDSNLIQETILTSISRIRRGRYNIFMVGDVKQSIYRFRLSRPELFMEKFRTYDVADSKTQRIDLHKNFRSRREVLASVNGIFRQIMTRDLGGITYDDQAALYTGADYPEGRDLETEVLVVDSDMDGWETEERVSERELEARLIAGRIRKLKREHQVVDRKTGKFRPVRYSDIVILIRSIRGFADVFTEVLNREGIPSYAGTREGYFAAQEIGIILDYLRVLDNRRQDIPLAAVLTSPLGWVSEEELAVIRSTYPDLTFCQAAARYCDMDEAAETRAENAEGIDHNIYKKLKSVFEKMNTYRKIVPYTPIHELLWKILQETGYEDYVSAMPGGEQRRANLEMLVEKARAFESTSYKGLFHFVRYIEQLRKYDVDYGEANIEDEQSDTVRIMTIHKSKGLEFPIVFAAGMGKRFNMMDARSSVVLHAGLGVGLDAIDLNRRTKSPSVIKRVIQKEETLDSLGEELRILYVVLTRAKEKLILTGTISNLDQKLRACERVRYQKNWELSFGLRSKASTYWDWILPALVRLDEKEPIRMEVISVEDIVEEEIQEEAVSHLTRNLLEEWDTDQIYDQRMREHMERQFGYHYPYESSGIQKLKFTVSELKKRIYLIENAGIEPEEAGEVLYEEPEVVPLIPEFLKQEELSGASRGTAYHRLLELLDFSRDYNIEDLPDVIVHYREEGRLTADMASCIQTKDIFQFLTSPIGRRVKKAERSGKLWKEQPFVLGVEGNEIYSEVQEGELILVQGIIDVYFEEEDGLVVLDYKTDRVSRAEDLIEKYHGQLDYYAKALEQITGKRVKEKVIYSFALRTEIDLP